DGIAQVFAAPAHPVRFFSRVHRHEPEGKRTRKVGCLRGRSVSRAFFELNRTAIVACPAQDRRQPIALDQLEELLASLVAKRLADQPAERMYVLAQRGVFDGELNALTIHKVAVTRYAQTGSLALKGEHGEILFAFFGRFVYFFFFVCSLS